MKNDARTYELLRNRDALRRSRQVWAAGTVLWAVVLGWVVWGAINGMTDLAEPWVVWLVAYLAPVLVLGGVTAWKSLGIRRIGAALDEIAAQSTKDARGNR